MFCHSYLAEHCFNNKNIKLTTAQNINNNCCPCSLTKNLMCSPCHLSTTCQSPQPLWAELQMSFISFLEEDSSRKKVLSLGTLALSTAGDQLCLFCFVRMNKKCSEVLRCVPSVQTSRSTLVSVSSLTSKVPALWLLSWAVTTGAPLACLRLSDVQVAIAEIIFTFIW